MKPETEAEKKTRSVAETVIFTRKTVEEEWLACMAEVQRPFTLNDKVRAMAARIKDEGGVVPGTVEFAKLGRERQLVDGQHRLKAFLLTDLEEGYADTKTHFCKSKQEVDALFEELNGRLVNLKPDSVLKSKESRNTHLQAIRAACPFVGYENVRRSNRQAGSPSSPLLSMSTTLRAWAASRPETPTTSNPAVVSIANALIDTEAAGLIGLLKLAYAAWGADKAYYRLWSGLNLTLCCWLYRRLVISQYSPRTILMDTKLFGKCLTALSADAAYIDWLANRNLAEIHRGPAYSRIRRIFSARIVEETGKKPNFPSPPWTTG